MTAKVYGVLVPIAGHAYVQVTAENEEEAIELALDDVELGDIEEFEALRSVNSGNVCYFPSPWEATAEAEEEEEEEE